VVPLEGGLIMPKSPIDWIIYLGAGIALGVVFFLGL
jgi:hypothetical protein